MTTTTFQAQKGKNDALLVAPLNSLVCAHAWVAGASYIPAAFVNSSGALLAWPTGWQTLGELQKKAGVDLTPDLKTNEIGGLGSIAPRRVITTDETMTIDFTAQEWRLTTQSMFYNTSLASTTVNTTTGEWRASKLPSPIAQYWSLIVMAYDGLPGGEIYPFWVFPKVSVTKIGKISLQDGQEMAYPMTLTVFQDNQYTSPDGAVGPLYDFGVTGLGNIALAAAAGLLPTVTGISVIPTAATIAHTAQLQLEVLDSNSMNVTSQCTFSSGTPADATVSSSGLVSGVATGSSVITASYTPPGAGSPFTATSTITLT